jgi:hypothetical protein
MLPERLRLWWHRLDRWERRACLVWTLVFLAITLRVLLCAPKRGNGIYLIVAHAARSWCEGTDLYFWLQPAGDLDHFRYSPIVAASLVPFGLLPDCLGGILWRLFNLGVFLGGLAWFIRAVLPYPLSRSQRAVLFLLTVPLAIGSLNNGQSNALVVGLLLAGVAAVIEQRWYMSSSCVAAACLLKLYPIAVGLLLGLLYPRRFIGRFLAALGIGLAIPFLLQRPEYVLKQYSDWLQLLCVDDRSNWPLEASYRDLWLLFRLWHVPISYHAYLIIQLVSAAGVAGICLAGGLAGWPLRRLLTSLVMLSFCWILLCGPATESCTYIFLAPVLGWAVQDAYLQRRPYWLRLALLVSCALSLAAEMANWSPAVKQIHALGPKPLAALLVTGCLVWLDLCRFRAGTVVALGEGNLSITRAA